MHAGPGLTLLPFPDNEMGQDARQGLAEATLRNVDLAGKKIGAAAKNLSRLRVLYVNVFNIITSASRKRE